MADMICHKVYELLMSILIIDKQYDIMWEEHKMTQSPRRLALFCSSHIMTSYCVSITEQTTAKSYLFVK
jgi:hypothetical protein